MNECIFRNILIQFNISYQINIGQRKSKHSLKSIVYLYDICTLNENNILNVDNFYSTASTRRPRDQIEIGIAQQQSKHVMPTHICICSGRYKHINEFISPNISS